MTAIFFLEHTVDKREIDSLGHVNNLAYLRWMQDAAVAHSVAQGWPTRRYLELRAGWVVRSHLIDYLAPAYLEDRIVVQTWVAGFKKISSLRRYKIVRPADNKTLALAATNWVFVGFDHQAPRRVPAEIRDAFEVVDDPNPG